MNVLLLGYYEKLIKNFITSWHHHNPEDIIYLSCDNKDLKFQETEKLKVMPELRKKYIADHNITDPIKINYIENHIHISKLLAIYYMKHLYNVEEFFYSDDDCVLIKHLEPLESQSWIIDPFLSMKYGSVYRSKNEKKHGDYILAQEKYIEDNVPGFDFKKIPLSGNMMFKYDPVYDVLLEKFFDSNLPQLYLDCKNIKRASLSSMDDTVMLAAFTGTTQYKLAPNGFLCAYSATKHVLRGEKKLHKNAHVLHYAVKDKYELTDEFLNYSLNFGK